MNVGKPYLGSKTVFTSFNNELKNHKETNDRYYERFATVDLNLSRSSNQFKEKLLHEFSYKVKKNRGFLRVRKSHQNSSSLLLRKEIHRHCP